MRNVSLHHIAAVVKIDNTLSAPYASLYTDRYGKKTAAAMSVLPNSVNAADGWWRCCKMLVLSKVHYSTLLHLLPFTL